MSSSGYCALETTRWSITQWQVRSIGESDLRCVVTCTQLDPRCALPCFLAALYVIPADATNPVSHFEALQSQVASMPPAMQSTASAAASGGQAGVDYMFPATDRDFARHYVLLQDGSVMGPEEAADRRWAASKRAGKFLAWAEEGSAFVCEQHLAQDLH